MRTKLIFAAVFAGILGSAAVRTVGLMRMAKAPDAAVKCGRYYLDDGEKNAFIEVISADENGEFVMAVHNYDLGETAEHIMATQSKVYIGEVICDENGEPLRDENRRLVVVETEEQRALLQRKKDAELRQAVGDFLAETEHGFVLMDYGYDEVLEWYQYRPKSCCSYFDMRFSPKNTMMIFDEYIWKYEKK